LQIKHQTSVSRHVGFSILYAQTLQRNIKEEEGIKDPGEIIKVRTTGAEDEGNFPLLI
jgi:hypothetical protein